MFCFFSNLVMWQIIVYRRFYFFILHRRQQQSISICSFILALLLINSCISILQSSKVSFIVSLITFIRKLFCLDPSSNCINFQDMSFGSKISSSISLILVPNFVMFSLILFISSSKWSWVNPKTFGYFFIYLSRRSFIFCKFILLISLMLVLCSLIFLYYFDFS